MRAEKNETNLILLLLSLLLKDILAWWAIKVDKDLHSNIFTALIFQVRKMQRW